MIVLGSEVQALGGPRTTSAFGTPTVVHFCAVLLVSAVLSAPWPALVGTSLVLEVCGLAGILYGFLVVRHARRQKGYMPVWEDWLWHTVLPFVAYGALLVAAVRLSRHAEGSLFTIGASVLMLLFIGIHNAWDAVTYLALRGATPESQPGVGRAASHRRRKEHP